LFSFFSREIDNYYYATTTSLPRVLIFFGGACQVYFMSPWATKWIASAEGSIKPLLLSKHFYHHNKNFNLSNITDAKSWYEISVTYPYPPLDFEPLHS
jgi:hypothetical protein